MPRKKKIVVVGDSRKGNVRGVIDKFSGWMEDKFAVVKVDLDSKADLSRVRASFVVVFGGDGSLMRHYGRIGGRSDLVVIQ